MNGGVEKVNRELARLDTELRAGGIDRAMFRAERRRLLLDFEERETTTQPSAVSSEPDAGSQAETQVDVAAPFVLPEPSDTAPRDAATPPASERKKPVAAIVLYAVGAVAVLSLAAWWFSRPTSDAPASLPATPTAAGPEPGIPIAGATTPQSLATALVESQWSDADVTRFLDGWRQLPPDVIRAASEDSRIWLLRGETGQRLREARELESLEPSSELRARVEQLEMVQTAISTH